MQGVSVIAKQFLKKDYATWVNDGVAAETPHGI
jgi:hypothetical protein